MILKYSIKKLNTHLKSDTKNITYFNNSDKFPDELK